MRATVLPGLRAAGPGNPDLPEPGHYFRKLFAVLILMTHRISMAASGIIGHLAFPLHSVFFFFLHLSPCLSSVSCL